MPELDLRRLKKAELLEILLELEEENERLTADNRQLKERLAARESIVRDAGSIAEASLALSGVFEAAQEAVDTYVSSVRLMSEQGHSTRQGSAAMFTPQASPADCVEDGEQS